MITEPLKAPFPYFGGKRRVAPKVWQILGDVGNYVEPFCGSMAVLLARPPHHKGHTETVNDADGWLINAWRSIQLDPETTARHASGPVSEVDYHAQLAWLQSHRDEYISWLEGDPEHYDPKLAGWWLRVIAAGIGDPFGPGPWHVVDGHLVKDAAGRGVNRELPHLGNSGRGVNRGLSESSTGRKQQKIQHYLTTISHRLETTRITCGDWRRVLTNTPLHADKPTHQVGVFLDPPYEVSGNLYAVTNRNKTTTISQEVRAWCRDEAPTDHGLKIILCGYENEHDELLQHGWHKTTGAHNTGGYVKDKTRAGKTEQLWLSPACEDPDSVGTLF